MGGTFDARSCDTQSGSRSCCSRRDCGRFQCQPTAGRIACVGRSRAGAVGLVYSPCRSGKGARCLPPRRFICACLQRRSGGSRSFRSIRPINAPAAPSCWSNGLDRVCRHSISNRSRGPNAAGRLSQSFEYPKRVCLNSIVVAAKGRVTHDYFRVQCLGFDDANVALKCLAACKSQPSQQGRPKAPPHRFAVFECSRSPPEW
jgi:hypothetical protein